MVQSALAPGAETTTVADSYWVAQTADHILAVMENSRSTWQVWHVRAEVQRQVRIIDVPAEHATALVDLLVDEVLERRCVALAAPRDGIEEPQALRRVDGSSVYTVAGANLYTSQRILDAEQRLVIAAGRRDGAAVDESAVDLALLEMAANRTALDAGQASLVRQMCTSGARLQLAIAPAGAGRPPPCVPSPWPGPKTAASCSASPRRLPQPLFLPSRPASTPTPSPNSPGHYSMASCPTGRPRSARRHW